MSKIKILEKKELQKSENERFKEFTKTILINLGKNRLSLAKLNSTFFQTVPTIISMSQITQIIKNDVFFKTS